MRYIEKNRNIFSASDKTLLKDVIQHSIQELDDSPGFAAQDALSLVSLQKSLPAKSVRKDFYFESKKVRMLEIDGQFWWVAKDVCDVLGIQNVTQAVGQLEEDERSMFSIGRQGEANIINESGLYTLILRSNKPEAKKFRKWVTAEVLPSLRKDGIYVAPTPHGAIAESEKERKLAVREKYAEARRLEALAKNTRALCALAKDNQATLPQGFIERVANLLLET